MAKPGTYSKDGETRVAHDKREADRMSWSGWKFVSTATKVAAPASKPEPAKPEVPKPAAPAADAPKS